MCGVRGRDPKPPLGLLSRPKVEVAKGIPKQLLARASRDQIAAIEGLSKALPGNTVRMELIPFFSLTAVLCSKFSMGLPWFQQKSRIPLWNISKIFIFDFEGLSSVIS